MAVVIMLEDMVMMIALVVMVLTGGDTNSQHGGECIDVMLLTMLFL